MVNGSTSKLINVITFVPDGRILLRRTFGQLYNSQKTIKNKIPWQATFFKTSWAEDESSVLDDVNNEFDYYFKVPARDIGTLTLINEVFNDSAQPIIVVTLHMDKNSFVHLTCKNHVDISTMSLENLITEINLTPNNFTYQTCKAIEIIVKAWKLEDWCDNLENQYA